MNVDNEKELVSKLLELCKKAGYKRIAINCNDPKIAYCKVWTFEYDGSVFASPTTRKINDWPAIWDIVSQIGIWRGYGRNHQASITKAISGQYKFALKKGEWINEMKGCAK